MKPKTTQSDWVRTALRLPSGLHADVHAEAKRQDRTFNGQIVAALRKVTPVSAAQQSQGAQQ